ncbi:uncharacterized protein C1orf232-like [Xenopus laevis]|uniref:Testis development-related protein n=2 Tax=Xenopus laevis TaxID=8355 RepID=A0A974DM60_XENLA|nr:uncharacterized protein C1orf232-like [Xenopus laevis]OCT94464.1 hypothetical protein XELAEV_18012136mg [Xenopus laevis]
MSQNFWKLYKSKVLQSFNAEQEEEPKEENDTVEMIEEENPEVEAEGLNMSQLAQKVQGALGWRSVASLFSKEEEQQPEQVEEQSPEEQPKDNPPPKRSSALWDVFANRWQQSSAERSEARGVLAEPPEEPNEVQPEETPFRWGFLTSKIAELRSKNT